MTGATIDGDGVTSTNSPPGGVMRARVTGDAVNGQTWRGTQYQWGDRGRQCVDTDDKSGDNRAVEFNVTAPGDPGNYDAGFTARGANDCGGDESNEKVLTNALTRHRARPESRPPAALRDQRDARAR